MRTAKNFKNLNILFFSFWICVALVLSCCNELGMYNFCYAMKIIFAIFFVMLILKTLLQNDIFSIYFLFLGFSIFFVYSRLIFDFIEYAPINKTVFMRFYYFSDKTVAKFLLLSIIFYSFIDFGYYLYHKKYNLKKAEPIENKFGKRTALLLFIFFSIIFFYKCLLDIKAMQANGYTANVKEIRVNYPFWTIGSGTFFYIFFYLFLMYKRTKTETIFVIFLYTLISFSSGMKGTRAAFFIPFIFALYYLHKVKIININLKKLILIVSFSFLGIYVITISRGDNLENIKNIGDLMRYIFYYQGTTIGLPFYYIEFKDHFDNIPSLPYILADLIHLYSGKIESGGNIVSSFVNIHHFEDAGFGESFLLELLNLPLPISLFVCIFIGKIINFTEHNFTKNIYLSPLLIAMMSGLFYIPRNALFCFLVPTTVVYLFATNFFFIFEKDCKRFLKLKKSISKINVSGGTL